MRDENRSILLYAVFLGFGVAVLTFVAICGLFWLFVFSGVHG